MNFVCSVTPRVEKFSSFHLRLPNRRGKSKHSTSAQDQRSPWGRPKGRMIGRGETVSPKLNKEEKRRGKQRRKETEGAKCSQGRSFISWKRPPNIRLANRMLPFSSLKTPHCVVPVVFTTGLESLGLVVWSTLRSFHSLYTNFFPRMWPMSHCQNDICTRTQKIHKCRQIKNTNQQQDAQTSRPAILQPDLRFVRKNSKPDTQKGQEPKQQTHKKDLPRDTADFTTVSHSKTCQN